MKYLIKAEVYKLRISKLFRFFLIASFCSSFASVIVIKMLGSYVSDAPQEMLDKMLSNGVYNFGFIQVADISDMVHMTSGLAISSAFKNFFTIIFSATFVSMYLMDEYKNGGIRNFIIKGYSRNKVLFSKYITTVVALVLFLLVYFVGYCCTAIIMFDPSPMSGAGITQFILFFIIQVFLIVSFASICFATAIFTQRVSIVILNAGMVLLGEMAINIMNLLTKGNLDLSKIWVLSYVMKQTPDNLMWISLFVGAIFIVSSLFLAIKRFKRMEFS